MSPVTETGTGTANVSLAGTGDVTSPVTGTGDFVSPGSCPGPGSVPLPVTGTGPVPGTGSLVLPASEVSAFVIDNDIALTSPVSSICTGTGQTTLTGSKVPVLSVSAAATASSAVEQLPYGGWARGPVMPGLDPSLVRRDRPSLQEILQTSQASWPYSFAAAQGWVPPLAGQHRTYFTGK